MIVYCPNKIANEGKRHWLTGALQLCLRECVQTNGKWCCPKCGEVK